MNPAIHRGAAIMPTPTLTPDSRKRSIEAEEDLSQSKKQRTESPSPQPVATILAIEKLGSSPFASTLPTFDAIGKQGLRRSIALVLDSIGFDTARPEALESFVVMAENYLASLVEEVKASANKARRNQPIPRDFEVAFRRFNITTSSLMPHKKKKKLPVSRSAIIPTFEALSLSDSVDADLPILGADLDGTSNKQSKLYIPSSFPTFPSIHTYKYSPEAAENFTISDNWGEFEPDLPSEIVAGSQPQSRRPLAAEEIPYGDPKKLREAAAKEAKAGEAALRGLVRASKIARQKEVWASAQRNPSRRSRQIAWEAAMRDLLEEDTKAKGGEVAPAAMHGEQARMEIADHSMIVNTERRYYRQEVPRKSQGVANRA